MNILMQENISYATSPVEQRFSIPDSTYDVEIKYIFLWDVTVKKRQIQSQLQLEGRQDPHK